jgi:hypothetical protein
VLVKRAITLSTSCPWQKTHHIRRRERRSKTIILRKVV